MVLPLLFLSLGLLVISIVLSYRKTKTTTKLLLQQDKVNKQRIYQISILKEIQERIGYSLDYEKVIDVITGSLKILFPYSTASSLLIKDDRLKLKMYVEESVSQAFVNQVKKSMIASLTALSDHPLPTTIDDSLSGAILNETNTKPLASFFHIPLIVNNEVVALLNVSSTKNGLYKLEEMTILYQIVNEASRALTRLQEVLMTEKGKLLSLIGGLADGVFMIDTKNSLLVINEAAKSFLGIHKPEATIFDIISSFSHTYDIAAKMQQSIVENKVLEEKELQIGQKTVQVFITPVVHENTAPENHADVIGASILLHDITLEKQLSQIKEDFTNMMVHELRAPLTSIKDASGLLKTPQGMSPTDQEKMLSIIHDQAQLLLEQVGSLLDAAKLESGKLTMEKTTNDLGKILKERIDVFLPQAKSKNITLVSSLPDSLPEFSFDKLRISQVLNNLLSNSLKYTNAGGTVMLKAVLQEDQHGKLVSISISDNGIGIPKEKQSVLFSRFGQIATGEHAKLSSGLGLFITKGIVEAHEGSISLESEVGHGTTITVVLPIEETKPSTLSASFSGVNPQILQETTIAKNRELNKEYRRL